MKTNKLHINGIPSIIWGEKSRKVIIAVHGNMSNKEDIPIQILAKEVTKKGFQVLSFDLAQHGERKDEELPCKAQNSVEDLRTIMSCVKEKWYHISLFANSMGAYFSLIAYKDVNLECALFLSPVVDMNCIIENMMNAFGISKEQLEKEQTISTPIGQDLYWDYYCYVKENEINCWNVPTYILYGEKDNICEEYIINNFAKKFSCNLEVVKEAEHYFCAPKEIQAYKNWINKIIK